MKWFTYHKHEMKNITNPLISQLNKCIKSNYVVCKGKLSRIESL